MFLFCFISSFSPFFGQGLTVSVRDDAGPLPYANIFLNGDIYCIADSLGLAFIPEDMLADGITLSSTYIGMEPCVVVYDRTMADTCVLTHREMTDYRIAEVAVTASDQPYQWKKFRELVKPRRSVVYQSCLVRGTFSYTLKSSGEAPKSVEGTFVLENRMPRNVSSKDFFNYYFAALPAVQTHSDTTGLSHEVRPYISKAINVACQYMDRLWAEHNLRGKSFGLSNLKYLGEADGKNHFRLAYSNVQYSDNVQILFEADRSSREITRVAAENVHIGSEEMPFTRISFSPQRYRNLHVPRNIGFSSFENTNENDPLCKIEITDLVFEPLR